MLSSVRPRTSYCLLCFASLEDVISFRYSFHLSHRIWSKRMRQVCAVSRLNVWDLACRKGFQRKTHGCHVMAGIMASSCTSALPTSCRCEAVFNSVGATVSSFPLFEKH